MPSDHSSPAVAQPTRNGDQPHRLPRLHKLVFPVPKLKPPIDPALLEHEKKRAEVAQNRIADRTGAGLARSAPGSTSSPSSI